MGIISSVCGLPNYPSSLKCELRPSWNNIHDMFPSGTVQDTTPDSVSMSRYYGSENSLCLSFCNFLAVQQNEHGTESGQFTVF